MMKVCSRANWPLKQAWLALSVKTIQVEPAGNSHRSLRQVCWKAGILLHRVVDLEHEAIVGRPVDYRQPQLGGDPDCQFPAGCQGTGLSVQAHSLGESSRPDLRSYRW